MGDATPPGGPESCSNLLQDARGAPEQPGSRRMWGPINSDQCWRGDSGMSDSTFTPEFYWGVIAVHSDRIPAEALTLNDGNRSLW